MTTTCHCCAVVFLQSRRGLRSWHPGKRPPGCKETAPDGAAVSSSAATSAACFPLWTFRGADVTTSRSISPGEDIPATKFLAMNPAKNFASAPGQLSREAVNGPPSERSTAGRNPEEVDGRRSFAPPGNDLADPAVVTMRRQCDESDFTHC